MRTSNLFALAALSLFSAATLLGAYTMPLGLPNPGWGVDEVLPARPGDWSSEVAGYYYVNQATGTNTGRTYGTPSAPRQTIPQNLPAGSRVEVAGTYSNNDGGGEVRFTGTGNGSAWSANSAGPVWITSAVEAECVITTRLLHIYGSYVYVDGIQRNDEQTVIGTNGIAVDADHIMVRNSEFIGDGVAGSCSKVEGTAANPASYVIWLNNSMHDWGDMATTADQDALGIALGDHATWTWVLDCDGYNLTGPLVRAGGASPSSSSGEHSHHHFIGRCVAHTILAENFWSKYGSHVVFSQVEAYNSIPGAGGAGIGLGLQYAPDNVWVIFSDFHDCPRGAQVVSSDSGTWSYYFVGNRFRNNSEDGLALRGTTNRHVIGNTFWNNDRDLDIDASTGTLILENNLIATITVATQASDYHLYNPNIYASTTARNNLFFQPSGAGLRIRDGGTTYTSVADWIAGTVRGDGSVEGDPLFVNTGTGDFSIATGSPAIGAALADTALTVDVYALYESTFGVSIRRDYAGLVRPQGATWDIGAYEFDESTSGTAPDAPTGPTATVNSSTAITLAWTDASADETGFRLYKDGVFVTTVAAGVETYQFTALTAATGYTLGVAAYNAFGDSATVTDTETTDAAVGAPPHMQVNRPDNLSASSIF